MNNIQFVSRSFKILAVILVLTGSLYFFGIRVNTTESIPQGIWLLSKTDRIKRGDVVIICIDNNPIFDVAIRKGMVPNGMCKNGTRPLFKPVAGIAGDQVRVASDVEVNGKTIENSRRYTMPHLSVIKAGEYLVPHNQLWLVSSYHPGSFDSRYFGSVSSEQVLGVLEPLWLW